MTKAKRNPHIGYFPDEPRLGNDERAGVRRHTDRGADLAAVCQHTRAHFFAGRASMISGWSTSIRVVSCSVDRAE